MTRDIPVFDTAENNRIGPGAALAWVGLPLDDELVTSNRLLHHHVLADPEIHLRGDWSWRPYRRDDGSRYSGAPATPRRYCAPSVFAGLDAQAKTHYMPDFRL